MDEEETTSAEQQLRPQLKLQGRIQKLKEGSTNAGMTPFKLPFESTIFQEELERDMTV